MHPTLAAIALLTLVAGWNDFKGILALYQQSTALYPCVWPLRIFRPGRQQFGPDPGGFSACHIPCDRLISCCSETFHPREYSDTDEITEKPWEY